MAKEKATAKELELKKLHKEDRERLVAEIRELKGKSEKQTDAITELVEKVIAKPDFDKQIEIMKLAHLQSIHNLESLILAQTEQMRFMRQFIVALTVKEASPEAIEKIQVPSYMPFETDRYLDKISKKKFY